MSHRYTLAEIKNGTGWAPGVMFDTVEDYNGWANRETWAFWLHVTNDQGWYNTVKEQVAYQLEAEPEDSDSALGEAVVEYVKDTLEELGVDHETGKFFAWATAMRDEIGSWWRIDHAEIGRAARELVSE